MPVRLVETPNLASMRSSEAHVMSAEGLKYSLVQCMSASQAGWMHVRDGSVLAM